MFAKVTILFSTLINKVASVFISGGSNLESWTGLYFALFTFGFFLALILRGVRDV